MSGFDGLTHHEKENVLLSLQGCINRICVSDDPLEVVRLMGSANHYLAQLGCNSLVRISQNAQ